MKRLQAFVFELKVHTQIANARRDFLHKSTTTISKKHALV
jgi:putative transposase